jgi:hypothetical protein
LYAESSLTISFARGVDALIFLSDVSIRACVSFVITFLDNPVIQWAICSTFYANSIIFVQFSSILGVALTGLSVVSFQRVISSRGFVTPQRIAKKIKRRKWFVFSRDRHLLR